MEGRFIYFLNFFRVKVWLRTVAERKTEGQKNRKTYGQKDRKTERQRDIETERQRDREIERQRDREHCPFGAKK